MPRAPIDSFPPFHELEPVIWPGFALLLFVLSGVITDVIILLATRLRLVDLPNRRSAHSLPTARGGGLAIITTTVIATVTVTLRWPAIAPLLLVGTLLPCLVIGICGIIDDVRPLNAILRLALQIGAAIAITIALGPLRSIEVPGIFRLEIGPAAIPLTILWIVGLTNAFNFMDGIDGMAATAAVVGGLSSALFGLWLWSPLPMLLGAFVSAAAAGFLVFNWQPARIFMGDAGSGFLGIWFAALPLLFPEHLRGVVIVSMAAALWPYIYDPFLSVLRRLFGGHNPLKPHREFLFHRLVRSGWSHAATTILYAVLAILGMISALGTLDDRLGLPLRMALSVVPALLAIALTLGVEWHCARRHLAPTGSSAFNPIDTSVGSGG